MRVMSSDLAECSRDMLRRRALPGDDHASETVLELVQTTREPCQLARIVRSS